MSRLDYGKAKRVQLWRESSHNQWSGEIPAATKRATSGQIGYIQDLLEKLGRRPYTDRELSLLTIASASRLIQELKAASK